MKTMLKVAAYAVFLVYFTMMVLFIAAHYANGAEFPVWLVFLWPLAVLGIALGI